jgi:hypothetical protein
MILVFTPDDGNVYQSKHVAINFIWIYSNAIVWNKFSSIYRVSQEECAILPYVKVYRYNPKHLYPKLNGYGDNGQRSLKL